MRKLMRIIFAPCGEEWIVYKCSIQKLCNGGMREEKSKYKWKIKKVDNNSTDQNVQRRENWKAKRVGVHFNKTFVMKKFLIVGIISILACSANAASFQSEVVVAPTQTEIVAMYTAQCTAKDPQVIKRGDRVIIIYSDGTTIIVDKDGKVVRVPWEWHPQLCVIIGVVSKWDNSEY